MTLPVIDSPVSVTAFVIGTTQLVKDAGVQGQWLKVAAVLSGVFAPLQGPSLFPELMSFSTGIRIDTASR